MTKVLKVEKNDDGVVTLGMVLAKIMKDAGKQPGDVLAVFDAADSVASGEEEPPPRGAVFYLLWRDGGFGSIILSEPLVPVPGEPMEILHDGTTH